MKKNYVIVIPCVILLAISLAFYGYAKPALASPKSKKPIELKWASHMPDTNRIQKYGIVGLGTQVEKATKGRVKVIYYSGGSLAKGRDIYDAVAGGIADIGYVVSVYYAGRLPVTELFHQYLRLPKGELSSRILWELYEKFPKAFNKEYRDVKVLSMSVSEPAHIGSRRPIRSVEDVKGLKIRAVGAAGGLFKRLGAIPISIPVVEFYSALQTGIIDAYVVSVHVTGDYRLYELVDYFTDLNVYTLVFVNVMNLDKWNSLPSDIQKQLMSVFGMKGSMHIGRVNDTSGEETLGKLAKMQGKQMVTLTAEQRKAFLHAAEPIRNEFLAKLEAKGLPGRAISDELERLVEKYSK